MSCNHLSDCLRCGDEYDEMQDTIASKDAEIARLREALVDVQCRIEILADDGIYWIDDPSLCGFDLYKIDKALEATK